MSESQPQSPAGSETPEAESPTVIDAGALFEGLLTFRGAARVEGRLEGRIVAQGRLEIGPRARIDADIEADEVVVGGAVEGDIDARERLELLGTARVTGTLRTPRLILAEGCVFDGSCETAASGQGAARGDSGSDAG